MDRNFDVIIAGCGIAGASLAHFLSARGLRVAVFERGQPGSGGTNLSAAIVRQHYSTELMARLALRSVQIFADAEQLLGRDAGYRAVGYYFLASDETLAGATRNVAMQRALGIDTAMLALEELAERCPWLNLDGVAGAAHEPAGGFADPEVATAAFLASAGDHGAEVRLRTPVRSILRQGDRVVGVMTDAGPVHAGWVVNAAGPWAAGLAASAGIPMRMRSVREQDTVWEARAGRPLPESSVSNTVDAIYIRPLGARRFIVGRGFPKDYHDVDPCNYKTTADADFEEDVQLRLTRRIPAFEGARLVHSYAALYDVTADWYQYVGPREGLEGYADFCGGSGHGFKVAPAIAEELAAWLHEGKVDEDFSRLSHDRVEKGALFVQSYGGNRG